MIGVGKLVAQSAEIGFVADCRTKPVMLVGHVKMTFVPAEVIVSCDGLKCLFKETR